MLGSDPLTAYCADGSRRGETHHSKHRVCGDVFYVRVKSLGHTFTVIFVPFRNIMSNRVFYQHPNLMRALGMHETVMEVMVNVLGGGDSKVN